MKIFNFKKIARSTLVSALSLLLAIIPAINCSGTSSPTNAPTPQADVVLTGTNEYVASQLVGQYDRLTNLAQNPGQSISIAVAGPVAGPSDEPVIIRLSFNPDGKPVLTRPDSTQALLELGLTGFKLTDARSGKIITEQVIEMGAMSAKLARGQQLNPADWVQAGIGVIGAAILVWLGIKVVSLTAVGLGYLALAAIVVGAVVVGGGVITNVFKTLGWDIQDFTNLFRQSFNDLAAMISGAIQMFQKTYNLG